MEPSATPFAFQAAPGPIELPKVYTAEAPSGISLEEALPESDTIAFLVIKDDRVLFEKYYRGHSAQDVSQLFSASKSLLAILIGAAIEDGYIQSVGQPVTAFVPELAPAGFDEVTIENLLNMQSNLAYYENDEMVEEHMTFNYTNRLEKEILKLQLLPVSDRYFQYKSGDNALLGLILERALDDQSITAFMQARLWGPLGMQDEGDMVAGPQRRSGAHLVLPVHQRQGSGQVRPPVPEWEELGRAAGGSGGVGKTLDERRRL